MTLLPEAVFNADELSLLRALLGDAMKNMDNITISPFGINVDALTNEAEAFLVNSGRTEDLQKLKLSKEKVDGVLDRVRREGKATIVSTISKLALYENCLIQ